MSENGRKNGVYSKLALRLAVGDTNAEAAEVCGYNERTVYRKLKEPEFAAEVQELRHAMTSQAAGRASACYRETMEEIYRMAMACEKDFVRLSALRAVIELGAKLRGESDFETRLRKMEERLEAAGIGGTK